MDLPEVEVSPGEPLFYTVKRFEEKCRSQGIQLFGFEPLNTTQPIARWANYFQARVDGSETIIVVMNREWTEDALLMVLNNLLDILVDPDPPGASFKFRFYSAYPVPPLLNTLFGDNRISSFECRAARAARFGIELKAEDCIRLASVALQLLLTHGIRTNFEDPDGIRVITDFVIREIFQLKFPPEGMPLNSLICLGCLYGELLRSRLPYKTDWAVAREYQPWPCLVVRSRPEKAGDRSPVVNHTLGFSPIAMVILLSQEGTPEILEKGTAMLLERCQKEL